MVGDLHSLFDCLTLIVTLQSSPWPNDKLLTASQLRTANDFLGRALRSVIPVTAESLLIRHVLKLVTI